MIKTSFGRTGPPNVVAVSNNTWCQTRSQQITAARIINEAAELATNSKLYRVDSAAGTQLLVLNAQTKYTPGGQLLGINSEGVSKSDGPTWHTQLCC